MGKGKRRRRRQRVRYGWVLRFRRDDPRLRGLSPVAERGLRYTRLLAENADDRKRPGRDREPPPRLTLETLAFSEDVSRATVSASLKRFRVELFGADLSDSSIYTRLRHGQLGPRQRRCAEDGCARWLAATVAANARYCPEHATPRARLARHRHKARGLPGPPPATRARRQPQQPPPPC